MAAINHPLGRARRGLPIPAAVGALNWWVLGAVLMVGMSAMLPVLQNSTATSRGFNMQHFQADETKLKGEISLVEANVAVLTSLSRIERRATEMGLGPTDNPIYVRVDIAGPAPAKIPSEYLPTHAPTRDEPEPWWRSLFNSLSLP